MKKQISVLLPSRNGEAYIEQSVRSVLSQRNIDLELLIGLNDTTDNTKNILNRISSPNTKIFDYGDEKGVSNTLNKLIKEASADWVAIQDDDDVWSEHKLESQIKHIGDYDVIGTQIFYIDAEGNYPTKYGYGPRLETEHENIVNMIKCKKNHIANSSSIIKKSKIKEVGGWNQEMSGIEDLDLWTRIAISGGKFVNLEKIFVLHRVHEGSNFNTQDWDSQFEKLESFEN